MDTYSILKKVRAQKPLIHHLTNWVTIYDCANIVKVFGASPVMAHAPEEAAEMTQMASSLVLNIGTLTVDFVEAMKLSVKAANKKGIPVILDVCGAGATQLRDKKCFELVDNFRIDIIKGNTSEIARIAGEKIQTKGVDSADVKNNLADLARGLSLKYKNTVVITGEKDIIADGKGHCTVKNGHAMMGQIVGTGCMAASVIGTFAAVEDNLKKAAMAALCCFGIAGELAAREATGPGSFKERLFDEVYNLNKEKIQKMQKVR
ncbi:MAG TPA: hydroxyethylthiazole kinase [Candidatus Omnitrophota bacterium]|nr:hydroxyethylthiazole kinase [Candidatus Omnitrophota bacterium]HPD84657.1 hydroxyethylthiazole kinase [Candidatus Omnitrophota bacterium]HRZ03515.1 hydroxyethylthiazole kinase [Candidatus Omnitrophota bacterium]